MSTPLACSVLDYLHENIQGGFDSLKSARSFVKGLEGLTSTERLFLEAALSNVKALKEFYERFPHARSRSPALHLMSCSGNAPLGRHGQACS